MQRVVPAGSLPGSRFISEGLIITPKIIVIGKTGTCTIVQPEDPALQATFIGIGTVKNNTQK